MYIVLYIIEIVSKSLYSVKYENNLLIMQKDNKKLFFSNESQFNVHSAKCIYFNNKALKTKQSLNYDF